MAKAGKKRITSADKRRARDREVLAAIPDLAEYFRRQDEARGLLKKAGDSIFSSTNRRAPALETLATKKTPTSSWVSAEARRMKDAGEISEPIRITDFARLLRARMRDAAKTNASVRLVTWQHIKNELPGWGLWPISLIKG